MRLLGLILLGSLTSSIILQGCRWRCPDNTDPPPLTFNLVIYDQDSNNVFEPGGPNVLQLDFVEATIRTVEHQGRIVTWPNPNGTTVDYMLELIAFDSKLYEEGEQERYMIHYKDTSIVDTLTLYYDSFEVDEGLGCRYDYVTVVDFYLNSNQIVFEDPDGGFYSAMR